MDDRDQDREDGRNQIEDSRLRRRLRAALSAESVPSHLVERVRDLALRMPPESAARERGPLVEMLPALCGLGLLLALLAGSLRHLTLAGASRLSEGTSTLLAGILLPLGVLAVVELLRGAPTLRGGRR